MRFAKVATATGAATRPCAASRSAWSGPPPTSPCPRWWRSRESGAPPVLLTEALPGPRRHPSRVARPISPRWCGPSAGGCAPSTRPSARSGAPSASTSARALAHVGSGWRRATSTRRGFHEEHAHLTPAAALAELEATAPRDEDLVVCHGDYCPPNVLLAGGSGHRLRRPRRAGRGGSLVGHRRRRLERRLELRGGARAAVLRELRHHPRPGAHPLLPAALRPRLLSRRRRSSWRGAAGEHGVEHRHRQLAGEGVLLARVVRAEQGRPARGAGSRPGGRRPGGGGARSGRRPPARRTVPAPRRRRPRAAATARGRDTARRPRAPSGWACWRAARSAPSAVT